MIVQTGCPEVLNRGAKIIFIEKRRSFPASYEQGRHAALARSLSRTRNVFLTKMDTLRRQRTAGAARLNCHMPDTNILCSRSRLGRAACLNCHMPDANILCSRSRLGRAARLNCHVPGAKIIFIEINIKNVLDGPDGACYIYVVEKQAEPRSHPGAIGRPGVHRYVLIRYSMTRWLCAAWSFFL